jgi:hypothetical protein
LADQLVMVAESWNSAVEQFTKTFNVKSSSQVLVLSNLLEDMIYGKVEMVPAFITDFSVKIEHFKYLIMERNRTKRMVICCNDLKTTNMLGLVVSKLGERATVLHSGQDMSEARSVFDLLCDTPVTSLVASDTTLSSLFMVGADRGTFLAQWDLPTDSKTTFSLRLTFIRSEVWSIFSPNPEIHQMLGQEDATLNTIIPFLMRRGTIIPNGLDLFYKVVSLTKAKEFLVMGSPL